MDKDFTAEDFQKLREKAIRLAKVKVKESVSKDLMIINAINNIEEIEKTVNVFASRLRDWFMIKNPELEDAISDNEYFVKVVLSADEGSGLESKSAMGAVLDQDDEHAIKALAAITQGMIETKTFLLLYLEKVMGVYCKNILYLAGPTIGAKLLRDAKSLKRFASLQSSTIQLLGAEKALFRHIKTGAKSPKYGHIVNHPLIINAKKDDKGKAARALADKLSMAARVDYFKGDFIADKYLADLKKKFN